MDETKINTLNFNIISEYIRKVCGIHLPYEKEYLIRQRLTQVFERMKITSFNQLVDLIKSGTVNAIQREIIISAITTNETFFFRDTHPFKTFKSNILPHLISKIQLRQQNRASVLSKINIWSAAASTGQEPYSIAISIDEYLKENNLPNLLFSQFQILATDIDSVTLDYAQNGAYTQLEVNRGLRTDHLEKYFSKQNDKWKIRDEIRKIIQFYRMSLHDSFSMNKLMQTFDVIFARNVLIYFDDATKRQILTQFFKLLAKDGFLVLGSSENLYGLDTNFESQIIGSTILYKPV